MRNKFSKAYTKLFLSFLLILGVPLLLSALIFLISFHHMKKQADTLTQNLLSMIKIEIDNRLESARTFAGSLYMDLDVQELGQDKSLASSSPALTKQAVYEKMQTHLLSNDFLDREFIYYKHNRSVVSTEGSMTARTYYDLYVKTGEAGDAGDHGFENFCSLLEQRHNYDARLFAPDSDKSFVGIMLSAKNREGDFGDITIVTGISAETLRKKITPVTANHKVEIGIVMEDGSRISPIDSPFSSQILIKDEKLILADNKGLQSIRTEKSDRINWYYFLLVPTAVFQQEWGGVLIIVLILLVVSSLIGSVLAIRLTNRNYYSLNQLMEIVENLGGPTSQEKYDEYEWLRARIVNMFQENMASQTYVENNKKQMNEYLLLQLIHGDLQNTSEEVRNLAFRLPYYCVVVLFPSGQENEPAPFSDLGLRNFVIQNICSETMSKICRTESFLYGDRVILICNLEDKTAETAEEIRAEMESMSTLIQDAFNFEVLGLIGPIQAGEDAIYDSYHETVGLEIYIDLLDSPIISTEEIKGIPPRYEYLADEEEQIVQAVKMGNEDLAARLIQGVFQKNFRPNLSLNLYHCILFEMLGTMLRAAGEAGYTNAVNELAIVNIDLTQLSGKEVNRVFLDCLHTILQESAKATPYNDSDANLVRQLEDYIQENFQDPDLNISIASLHFHLSPTYLSSVYKKQTGRSLLDFINKQRILHAENLIQSGASVTEAATASGFRDSGSFIRIYKKARGITPGQLKNTVK